MRSAELLAIGSELLGPDRLDTNGLFLSGVLGDLGITVRFRTILGDAQRDIEEALRIALGRSRLVLTTGGLGPTIDDRTREAVSAVLNLPLENDETLVRDIEERFHRHGYRMPPSNRRQAMIPRGAEPLPNRLGTAPGLFIRSGDATIVLLPGVPAEMRRMVEESVLTRLGPATARIVRRVLHITGLTESEVDRRLKPVSDLSGPVEWTILASPGEIGIHLSELCENDRPPSGIEHLDTEINRVLGHHVFGRDADTLESVLGGLLGSRSETLAVAESMTGGLVSRRVTSVPGASKYFCGGIVCYSERSKTRDAGVSEETLRRYGAVSSETAVEMAGGIRAVQGSTWGLATTGYAGPEGGPEGPPGTVWLAVKGPEVEQARQLQLPGDREAVCRRAATAALDLLRRVLLKAKG